MKEIHGFGPRNVQHPLKRSYESLLSARAPMVSNTIVRPSFIPCSLAVFGIILVLSYTSSTSTFKVHSLKQEDGTETE